LSKYKEILIMEMIEQEIPTKDYKIQYFLNSRFLKSNFRLGRDRHR
jgi:hypothetical protein